MPLYDLNVPWALDNNGIETARTLLFLKELGYNIIALAHTLIPPLPPDLTCPISRNLLLFPPHGLQILKRCTLVLTDTSSNYRLPALNASYDIVALRPTSERTLIQSCRDLDCDLLSLDLAQRFDFPLKAKTLMQAVERGILIELCYAPAVLAHDSVVRRNVISNATQLIRATKGRGIAISSQSDKAVGCRGPADVINLASVWGMGPERGKDALEKGPGTVCATAAMKRKSFRGVVEIIHGLEEVSAGSGGAGSKVKGTESTSQKRKLNAINEVEDGQETIEKPLSKREMKRRRKKEQLEKRQIMNE